MSPALTAEFGLASVPSVCKLSSIFTCAPLWLDRLFLPKSVLNNAILIPVDIVQTYTQYAYSLAAI